MRRMAILTVLVALAAGSVGAAQADEPYDAGTRAAIQAVITKQLDALSRDDGPGAESFASDAIRKKFPEPAQFLAMVRRNYAALIHPKSTQFGETAPSPHGPLQKMTIVAANGTVWNAIYSFVEENGAWRITGCGMEQDKSQQAI